MSKGYNPDSYREEQDKLYFVTLQVVERVDIFTRESYRKIIVENLNYCVKHKGMKFMHG